MLRKNHRKRRISKRATDGGANNGLGSYSSIAESGPIARTVSQSHRRQLSQFWLYEIVEFLWPRLTSAIHLSLFLYQIGMFIEVIQFYFNQCILGCERKLTYISNSYFFMPKGAISRPDVQTVAYHPDMVYENYSITGWNLLKIGTVAPNGVTCVKLMAPNHSLIFNLIALQTSPGIYSYSISLEFSGQHH